MTEFTAEQALSHLLNGGECYRRKNKQIIIFKDGCIKIKETGTLVGNLNGLELYENKEGR